MLKKYIIVDYTAVVLNLFFRSCRDLNTIYMVVRPLNGRNPNERVKEMFISPVIN